MLKPIGLQKYCGYKLILLLFIIIMHNVLLKNENMVVHVAIDRKTNLLLIFEAEVLILVIAFKRNIANTSI